MRVLHVHSGNLYGGVETLLRTLADQRGLCPEMEPEFALCFEGRLSRELESTKARVHLLGEVKASRPFAVLRARALLRQIVRDRGFDVAICHGAWSHAVFAPAIFHTTTSQILWLHDAAGGRHWVERWARLSRPDAVLCNSHYTATTLPNLYRNVPNDVVYCPVVPELRRLTEEHRTLLRAGLATDPDITVIVQVSRMEDWKGHELLIDALALMDDSPDVTVWFVGGAQRAEEAAYVQRLKQRAQRLGVIERIRFAGERKDVRSLLAAADIFCQPNKLPEPFGIVFIEALFAGLPVVATALGGAKEIIDSSCGSLVRPSSPAALAVGLKHLVNDLKLRRRLSCGGPKRAAFLSDPFTQLQKLHSLLNRFSKRKISDECVSLPVSV